MGEVITIGVDIVAVQQLALRSPVHNWLSATILARDCMIALLASLID